MDRDELVAFLRANLTLGVKTTSDYVGDMHGGDSLYQDHHTLTLILDGEIISEVSL